MGLAVGEACGFDDGIAEGSEKTIIGDWEKVGRCDKVGHSVCEDESVDDERGGDGSSVGS